MGDLTKQEIIKEFEARDFAVVDIEETDIPVDLLVSKDDFTLLIALHGEDKEFSKKWEKGGLYWCIEKTVLQINLLDILVTNRANLLKAAFKSTTGQNFLDKFREFEDKSNIKDLRNTQKKGTK